MEDSIHHKQLRQKLVNLIHSKGIQNAEVLEALNKVPRHNFVSAGTSLFQAYEDNALEIGLGQTISQPYTVAFQTALLNFKRGMKVLEIGTGSGYQTAVLFELGAELYSVERQRKLYESARHRLAEAGYAQVHCVFGDGYEGYEAAAPFDRILVTAAATEVPLKLLSQLTNGGVMVIPVNNRILRISKKPSGEFITENFEYFKFVPLLSGVVM